MHLGFVVSFANFPNSGGGWTSAWSRKHQCFHRETQSHLTNSEGNFHCPSKRKQNFNGSATPTAISDSDRGQIPMTHLETMFKPRIPSWFTSPCAWSHKAQIDVRLPEQLYCQHLAGKKHGTTHHGAWASTGREQLSTLIGIMPLPTDSTGAILRSRCNFLRSHKPNQPLGHLQPSLEPPQRHPQPSVLVVFSSTTLTFSCELLNALSSQEAQNLWRPSQC